MRPRRALAAVLLAVAAASLAGCGGNGGEGPEAAVEATLVAAGTSGDPADCARLHTQRFLDERSLEPGEAAIVNCELETVASQDAVAETVTVSGVDLDGEAASADAAFRGGNLDGQRISFALVEESGLWKVDAIVAFVRFDREGLLEAISAEMVELAKESGEAGAAACALGWFEGRDDATLEATVTEPDPGALLELFEACLRGGEVDRSV